MVKQKMARVNIDVLEFSELIGLEWVNLIQIKVLSTVGKNPLDEMK